MKNIILLTLLLILSSATNIAYANISGEGRIQYVVDGDTFDIQVSRELLNKVYKNNLVGKKNINMRNQTFRVRLANTDTAESTHYDSSRNTATGSQTSSAVKNKFSNQYVKFVCYKKGYYERAICDLRTKTENIALWLIQNEYSPYITKYGKHPMQHDNYTLASKNTSKQNVNHNNLDIDQLKKFRKPSKKKVAKAAWDYFNKSKNTKNYKKVEEKLDMQNVANQLYNMKQKSGKANMLTEEQISELSYLKNLKYN